MKDECVILGCGYVGSALAERWLGEGKKVWGVSRNAATLRKIRNPHFSPVVSDVDSADWHSQVPASPELVLNCVSSAGGGLDGYRKSYIGGIRSLLEWSRSALPARILYTGSTAVYPFSDGREVFEEDAGGDLSGTGQLVLESEQMLLGDDDFGCRSTVLRLAGIYGPGRHYLLDGLREGKAVIPGRGDYFLNLIFLEDIVSAVLALAAAEGVGGKAYNVADGHPPAKEEVARWLAERMGLQPPRFDPEASGGRRMRVNRSGEPPNRRVRIDRIMRETGWRPEFPSFREGYERLGV